MNPEVTEIMEKRVRDLTAAELYELKLAILRETEKNSKKKKKKKKSSTEKSLRDVYASEIRSNRCRAANRIRQ